MTVEQILAKLVSFPVLGGESNLTIIHWIRDYLNDFEVNSHLLYNEDRTKASLHCCIGPEVDGGVILSGHTDVVPVDGQEWTTDPFVLTDKGDGLLYGRGSCDMKGFVACCLAAVPKMLKAELKKPLYFAFSYDEEVGCVAAPELAESLKTFYKGIPKYAIIGEPSLMEPIVGQKGIYILETYVGGSEGHSSRIKQEVSAIHEAARLVMWLEAYMDQLIADGRLDQRFHPPHSSIHIGLIQGGIAPNVIANKAHFYWDLRTIPMDNIDAIIQAFEYHCRQREIELRKIYPEFTIKTVENHPIVPHLDTDATLDVVDLITRICGNTKLNTVAYAAEAGHFANAGFQSVICGPGSIAQAHRANEFIAKEELQKGLVMLDNLILELSKDNFN